MLAFTAFQDTLTQKVDFGVFEASVLQLMGVFGICIGLSAYMFAWHLAKANTRYQNTRGLRLLRPIADALYIAALAFPVLMTGLWLLHQAAAYLIDAVSQLPPGQRKMYVQLVSGMSSALGVVLVGVFIYRYTSHKLAVVREIGVISLRQQSIDAIEAAQQLYTKGNYAASILEAYRAVMFVLRAVLLFKNVQAAGFERSRDIIRKGRQVSVITREEQTTLEAIRKTRNKAAHLDTSLTQKQADATLRSVRAILEKLSTKIE